MDVDTDRPSSPYAIFPAFTDNPSNAHASGSITNLLIATAVDADGNLTKHSDGSPLSIWGPIYVDVGSYTNGEGVTFYRAVYASGFAGVIAELTPRRTAKQRLDLIKETVAPSAGLVGKVATQGVISAANAVGRINSSADGVSINGSQVLDDFDIFSAAGGGRSRPWTGCSWRPRTRRGRSR